MKLLQVDAFADGPFTGNPAAVCLLTETRDAGWMQQVAAEMNLSETAFLEPHEDGWSLRWFTPAVEVELCGHATLASAHVLWEVGALDPADTARFHSRSGLLTARRREDLIELNFPATPPVPASAPEGLDEALGVAPRFVGRSNQKDYLVEVDSEATVRRLQPDFTHLRRIDARGVMVTARAQSPGLDFVSRFFAPASGVDEDPVTGSAHCCLAPFWGRRLGKAQLTAYQASRRGGTLLLEIEEDRVRLAGRAVTVLRGELTV